MTIRLRFSVLCCLLLAPGAVWAHSPIPGMSSFYNGFFHPFMVPAHLLVLLALGLLLGQWGADGVKSAILLFPGAMVTGLVVMGYFGVIANVETLLLVIAVVLGLMVALAWDFPLSVYWVLLIVAGLMLGLDSVQSAYSGKEKLDALTGTGIGVCLGLLCTAAFAWLLQKRHWQQVAVRILGSWIAASALLTLTLILAPKPTTSLSVPEKPFIGVVP